jgi:hypothetical protein
MGSLGTRWDEQAGPWARAPGHDSTGRGLVIERLREPTSPEPDTKWRRVPLSLHILAARPTGAGR